MRLVEVEWIDPVGFGGDGWVAIADVDDLPQESLSCKTVGYLWKETEDTVILFSSVNYDGGEVNQLGNGAVIPKEVVRRMRDLL